MIQYLQSYKNNESCQIYYQTFLNKHFLVVSYSLDEIKITFKGIVEGTNKQDGMTTSQYS